MTDLPAKWCATSVAAISYPLRYGYTASADPEADGPKFLRITDIQDGQVLWPGVPRCEITDEKRGDFLLSSGDIVFARTGGTVGKSFLIREVPEPAVFASYLIKVSPAHGIEPRYLYWFFQSLNYWEQIELKKGGLQGNVNAKTLGSIELALAPTNEQRRIVEKIEAMFDEIDKGVESLHTARTTLGLYRQSLLKSAFEGRLTADWRAKNADKHEDPKTLLARIQRERDTRYKAALDDWQEAHAQWRDEGEKGKKPAKPKRPRDIPAKALDIGIHGWTIVPLGLLIDEPAYGTSKKSDYNGGEKGVLRIPNIAVGVIDATDLKSSDFDKAELEQYRLIEGDVLTIRSNGSLSLVGKPALVRAVDTRFVYAGYLIRLRPTPGSLVSKNLVYLMMAPSVRGQIENKAKSTSGVNNINAKELQELQVPICSAAEQAEIVRLLDTGFEAAEALGAEIDAALTRADAMRQSILRKAFSGQLVPQDLSDEPATVLLERTKAEKAERARAAKSDRKSVPSRKPKARRPTLTDLIEVLEKQKSWISASKAAQELGIFDGASSDDVEAFYRQLKDYVESAAIEVERRGDEDWLRLAKAEVG